jgi:ribosomal-protein-alanine N-acetyltransferase
MIAPAPLGETAPLPPGWTVERLTDDRDLDGVLEVDAVSFANHWTREMFEWEARHSDVARLSILREPGGRVAGYCAAWVIFDEVHINNMAVLPEWRGHGLGRALLARVLDAAAAEGAWRATLEVRASNTAARRLYARFGFIEEGRRPRYYTNPAEDAIIMWRTAGGAPDPARVSLETP